MTTVPMCVLLIQEWSFWVFVLVKRCPAPNKTGHRDRFNILFSNIECTYQCQLRHKTAILEDDDTGLAVTCL